MCGLRPKALSQPKLALQSQAQPKPLIGLCGACGSGFDISKPKARAWAHHDHTSTISLSQPRTHSYMPPPYNAIMQRQKGNDSLPPHPLRAWWWCHACHNCQLISWHPSPISPLSLYPYQMPPITSGHVTRALCICFSKKNAKEWRRGVTKYPNLVFQAIWAGFDANQLCFVVGTIGEWVKYHPPDPPLTRLQLE